MLALGLGHWALGGAAGALAGAITNFSINRVWVFPGASRRLGAQLGLYAVGSALTLAALELFLWLFVDVIALGEHVAWLPGKLLAFAVVSYPFQRLVVFRGAAA